MRALGFIPLLLFVMAVSPAPDPPSGGAETVALRAAAKEMQAFSRGDRAAFIDEFAQDAIIVDEAPPFVYIGSDAAGRWFDANRPNLRDISITVDRVLQSAVSVDGDRVFLAIRITLVGNGIKGRAFRGDALWTGVFERGRDGVMRIATLTISPAP